MAYENLLYEKRDGIGFITFNRPKVLNALNRKTMEELRAILIAVREDDEGWEHRLTCDGLLRSAADCRSGHAG